MLLVVHKFISEIDVTCAGAKVAVDYRYSKPVIIESDKACLEAYEDLHIQLLKCHQQTLVMLQMIHLLGKDSKRFAFII